MPAAIAARAADVAPTRPRRYQSVGIVPVDVTALGVSFAVGGS